MAQAAGREEAHGCGGCALNIQIDPEFKSLIPALSHEEYSQLEQNLIKETSPDSILLLTWNGVLIDGHNRYEICTKHNIPFKTVEKNGFKDRDDAKVWIIQNQFGRRNINLYQRNKLALNLKEILEKKAKEKEALRKTIQQTKPIELTEAERLLNIQLDGHYYGDLLRGNGQSHNAIPDNIYFIQDGDKVKIGVSCDVDSRLKDVTKHLPNAKLIGHCHGNITLEKSLHNTLKDHKINNEWFKINTTTVSIIKAFVPNADFCQLAEVSSQKEVIKKFDTSERTLARVKVIEQKAAPELKQKLETGEASINEVYKEIKKNEKEESRKQVESVKLLELPSITERYKIIHDDFRNVVIEPDSIDVIITDPPYPAEFLNLWQDMASFAKRVLKPSGFLIAYSGELHLHKVFEYLSKELVYYWTTSLLHNGNTQIVHARNVMCQWKPILLFQKAPFKKLDKTFKDVLNGSGREKDNHKWQQAESELSPLITTFSDVGDTILDPFAGSGTTLIAALKHDRKGIVIEKEAHNIEIIKNRVADVQNN